MGKGRGLEDLLDDDNPIGELPERIKSFWRTKLADMETGQLTNDDLLRMFYIGWKRGSEEG